MQEKQNQLESKAKPNHENSPYNFSLPTSTKVSSLNNPNFAILNSHRSKF